MFTKKKKEDYKDHSKGNKSDKEKEKDKPSALSSSSDSLHAHLGHKASKKHKEGDKEKDRLSTKANASSKPSLGVTGTKSNKELKKEHNSSKKFRKSSSAPGLSLLLPLSFCMDMTLLLVMLPKKGAVDQPEIVDAELYDFLCDPTNFDDGPVLKFKSKTPARGPVKDMPLVQFKRAGSDRSSRQSSSRSFSYS